MSDTPTFSPARQLVLNVLLSALVSAAVFVMVSQIVIVPQLARQQAQINALSGQVEELQAALEAEPEASGAAAPGTAAPGAAAVPGAAPASAAPAPAAAVPAVAK